MSQKTFSDKMFKCNRLSVLCWLVFYLILLALTKDSADAQEIRSPATEFNRHRLVQPVVHHARTKREITSTRHTEGIHQPEVTMTINIDGEDHVLDLRLNQDLVAGDHIISYQKDGNTVLHKPKIEELDICQYSGTVRGKKGSWVAISTCDGVRGIIHDGKQMRYIEPQENKIDAQHYIYDHSDLSTDFHCGYSGGVTNNTNYDRELMKEYLNEKSRKNSRISRYKRNADDTELRGPFNANKLSRYVELVLVADNREFRANGESITTIHRQLKDVANIINSVYAPLNIFIALVGVVVWTERDEIILEEDGDKTLTHFLHYRRNRLLHSIPNDNAHLLTRQKFNGGVVGKALKGPICTYQFSGGVATNHSEVIGLVATTIAHEMGHNFGMEHDTEADCTCPDDKCIMSPSSTSVTPTHWSSCSLRSLALSFERGMDYCLRNKPKRLFDSPTCGNGFVEPGEQCDCGLNGSAACLACCHPHACVLRSNATCAVGECCDPQTCRPKSAGTVCRSADKECDLPEYCSGYSEFCPRDVYKMDATPCSNNEAYCVRGSCRTHTDQCRLLWGSTGAMSDERCYITSNVKGDKKGNCGYQRGEQPLYYRCAREDVLCGLLQCKHLNERLEFGMESVSTLQAVFINNNGTILTCRTAMIDLGLSEVDPGMVPDGAKCGDDKMCFNQKCVPVEGFLKRIAQTHSSVCPSNCSGHGVCNSEGHCHCEPGFAPPLCALPGPGGSIDSGPATDSSLQRNFMVAMYVIFLGILPSILLIMFLMYYSKHDVLTWWKKPRKTYVSKLFSGGVIGRSSKNPKKSKSNFHFNLSSFSSSSSFIRLLSFKRKDKNETKNMNEMKKSALDSQTSKENIYANVCNTEPDYESLGSNSNLNKNSLAWYNKIINFIKTTEPKRETAKKIHRKINKEDIKVASDDVIAKNVEIKPDAKKNKPNVVIINTGLASTTNKNISKTDITPCTVDKINPVKAKHYSAKTKIDKKLINKDNIVIVNAGLTSPDIKPTLNTRINKTNPVISKFTSDKGKIDNKKLKDKNNLVIVNAGLASTTNNNIKTNNRNVDTETRRVNFKDLQSKFNQQDGVQINLTKVPK